MRFVHRIGLLALAALSLGLVYTAFVRPWFLDWGATASERSAALPGDDIIPDAADQNTRAITIDRPIEDVWPWLAQIGQDRGGFYSYRRLENLVGCAMPASTILRPAKQAWEPGDKLWMYPPDKANGIGFATLRVLDPGRVLGFATRRIGTTLAEPADGSWTFVLRRIDARSTRLLVRGRGAHGRAPLAIGIDHEIFDPMHFAMERRMMIGLARTAEGAPPSPLADDAQILLWVVTFAIVVASVIRLLATRRRAGRAFAELLFASALFQVLTLAQPHPAVGALLVAALVVWITVPAREGMSLAPAAGMTGRFSFGFVAGCFLLVIGATMALELLFGLSIPILRTALALALLVWGARLLARSWARPAGTPAAGEAWLTDRQFAPVEPLAQDTRYDVVFGRGVVDLTHLEAPASDVTVSVDTVFGNAVVKVDPNVAYDVVGHAAFGEVRMPDRTSAGMGSINFRHATDQPPHLHLRLSSVFGSCQVVEVARGTQPG